MKMNNIWLLFLIYVSAKKVNDSSNNIFVGKFCKKTTESFNINSSNNHNQNGKNIT